MKNILITGASRGIGESIAYYFADKGFNVVGTARSEFKFKKNNFKGTLIPIRFMTQRIQSRWRPRVK